MPEALEQLQQAVQSDGRFHSDAFVFLLTGLEQTSTRHHGPRRGKKSRHVSGQELSLGLRDAALERWGPLAPLVLERWGVRRTRDFGEMVYLLIGLGILGKQANDRIEDFDDVYSFDGAFEVPVRFSI